MTDTSAVVRLDGITKQFGPVIAVKDVNLEIRENEFFALLGPSGCGKTTLLRMLAGFEAPDEGRILLEGRDIARVPPYRRPFNMMFQSYALFPHMSVAENVGYGLRMERVARDDRERRVSEALELVQLAGMGRRRPHQLSGGQRQRVALARALVKRPRLLLLDEPLAALDRRLRTQMQLELKQLQAEVGITFVIVTHDQEEVLVMADRAAIMSQGSVLQVGAPAELYEWPASHFVASFVGESNMLAGTVEVSGSAASLVSGDVRVPVGHDALRRSGLAAGELATLIVRPERIDLRAAAPFLEPARVMEVDYLGASRRIVAGLADGRRIVARVPAGHRGEGLAVGEPVSLAWDPEHAALVPGRPS